MSVRVFVTGGAGFIGSNFIHHLIALGDQYQVTNYDKLTYAGNLANLRNVASNQNYSFVRGDICHGDAVRSAMLGCDTVVHFAAESHVDRSIYAPEEAIDANIRGTFTLLKIARELGIRRFVHISTDEVYGDLAPGEIANENSPLRPNSPYSASKAAADLLVRSYVRTYNFPAIITRSSNNYGPYQFPEKFIPLMISNALEDKPLPVYGDGKQERDWLHVEDNCRAIQMVLEHGRTGEIYNIGGGEIERNLDVLGRILRTLKKPESLLQHVPDRPGHDRRYALDFSKIKKELGWRPSVGLDDGLSRTVQWYSQNSEWLAGVRGGEYVTYYEKYYVHREASLRALPSLVKVANDTP